MAQDSPVVIVTGASRGAGCGIAVALGGHGYTVCLTGRSQKEGDARLPGTIHSTVAAVTEAGGRDGERSSYAEFPLFPCGESYRRR